MAFATEIGITPTQLVLFTLQEVSFMTIAALDIAKSMGVSEAELMREALTTYLQEKRRHVLKTRLELLSRYGVQTVNELEEHIADSRVPEHPGWEDLIVAENLGARLEELDAYLRDL